jgi:hypothetical protein
MPLQNNQNFTGTEPNQWSKGNSVKRPAVLPDYDIYAFSPLLSPASQFNRLYTGDTIKLFSLKVILHSGCFDDVKLFDHQLIPPGSPGLNGGDFSQGISIGGIKQLYKGNLNSDSKEIQIRRLTLEASQELTLTSTSSGSGKWRKWFTADKMALEEIAPGIAVVRALDNEPGNYTFICKNDTITDIACISVIQASSANDKAELQEMRFLPNPTQNVLYLHGGKWDYLEIRDLSGKLMLETKTEKREFDISAWSTGVYIASIRHGLQVMHVKLVKM